VIALLVFAVTLMCAVLVSGLAQRSILSTAVLFFAAGFLAGHDTLGLLTIDQHDPVVARLAEVALFAVLFVDGMKLTARDLRSSWHLPGRALLLGMPITLLVTALLARFIAGLSWVESFLIGSALSPTDPVLVSAIVGRKEIPRQLRHLLNIESGFNDGLALPVVIILIAVASGRPLHPGDLLLEIALGAAVGVAIPWVAIKLEETRLFEASQAYEPLTAFAVGLLVYAVAAMTHANTFLAAFAAGITVATLSDRMREAFHAFGELITEILQLAAILVFGALLSVEFLREIPASGFLFALLALVLPRAVAMFASLAGTDFPWPQRLAAAWFGPKGFASVLYTLWIVNAGIARADAILHLAALVIAGSIVAHSSTDVLIANWLQRRSD
jgi:NhaP-type Na+/H+ or K+/H+ antiporter